MKLSNKQHRAHQAPGHARIIAGPGSGKTTLLVERCRYLLRDPSQKLCLVTFARTAAQQIRQRLEVSVDPERITVSTFDALARQQALPAIGQRRPPRPFEHHQILAKSIRRLGLDIKASEAEAIITRIGSAVTPKSESAPEDYELFITYHQFLKDDGLIDFAAIAHTAVNRLRSGRTAPLDFNHILVDEFQDTSPVQLEWLRLHWESGVYVTVVGDDDQSIYGFRSAMGHQAMEVFSCCTDAEDFYLDECFRCAPEVIEPANRLIQYNYRRLDKRITSRVPAGGQVRYWYFEHAEAEMKALATFIEQAQKNASERTIAVLARNNFVLNRIESELRCQGVLLRRLGGTSIWDKSGGSVMLNLAEIVTQRSKEHAGSVINVLRWAGVAEKYLKSYSNAIKANGLLHTPTEVAGENATIRQFAGELNTWCAMLSEGHTEAVITCLQDWVSAHARSAEDQSVSELAANALIPKASSSLSLAQRLQQIQQSRQAVTESEATTVLELATFHGAKGLEWESVWITQAREGVIPSKPTLKQEACGDLLATEEERRLFYVAMTRAKRALVIAAAEDSPSRFNAETGIKRDDHPQCHNDSPWASHPEATARPSRPEPVSE